MLISAQANSVRSALAKARQVAGIRLRESRETIRSGGEDGCYRCTLSDGTVVEVTTVQHSRAQAEVVER